MITMLQTQNAIQIELQYGGKPASLVNALRFAAVSPLQDLTVNGKMARILSAFTNMPLPQGDALYAVLQPAGGVFFKLHKMALRSIDTAWEAGLLDEFTFVPDNYLDQCLWRDRLVKLLPGLGMKTVSFALLLFKPMACQLVAIDRHHLRRLNVAVETPGKKLYLAIETLIMQERDEEGYSNIPLGTFSAWKWGIQRNGIDAAEYPSHKALSPCWYGESCLVA